MHACDEGGIFARDEWARDCERQESAPKRESEGGNERSRDLEGSLKRLLCEIVRSGVETEGDKHYVSHSIPGKATG